MSSGAEMVKLRTFLKYLLLLFFSLYNEHGSPRKPEISCRYKPVVTLVKDPASLFSHGPL